MDGEKEVGPYLLFCGSSFYPSGGWEDFQGRFKTIDHAKLWLFKNEPDAQNKWAHIVHRDKIILWANNRNDRDFITNEWTWRDEE